MADNNIMKDFVKKQSSPISIGVPKMRSTDQEPERIEMPAQKTVKPATESRPVARTVLAPVEEVKPAPKKIGRPKSEIEKVKVSLYLPVDVKNRLVKLQHMNMKSCMNDVMIEAIEDLLDKYSI